MVSIRNILKYLVHDRTKFLDSCVKNLGCVIPDKIYLSLRFRLIMGYWIDWKNPKTFSEKIQWLKVYNHNSEYTKMVDKYSVKDYIADVVGDEYIIPTLGVWDKAEDIEWDNLPNQFVLKTTHGGGGGGVFICKDKFKLNKREAIEKMNASLKSDIYWNLREWPYKNVSKRIIAEKFMAECVSESVDKKKALNVYKYVELRDYKFFCFSGKVKYFKVDFDRFEEHHANYYTPEGCLLPFGEADFPPVPNKDIRLPQNLFHMIKLAEKLSTGEPFLRVDLYDVDGEIFFGELTFYPASGMGKYIPEKYDSIIGEYLQLPK